MSFYYSSQCCEWKYYARCLAGNPNTGEGMYQNVPGFVPGSSYTISYQFCGSNLWGGSGDCVWHMFIDDIDVNQSAVFSSGSPVWQTNYYTFTATMTTHKIGFRAYTPTFNGGGSAAIDDFIITESKPTGIENDIARQSISVFPNPVSDEFTIYVVRCTILKVQVYDEMGRSIFRQQPKANGQGQLIIDVSYLNRGVYLAEIFLDNGSVKRVKFVKE